MRVPVRLLLSRTSLRLPPVQKKFEVSNNKSKWEENLSDEVAIEKKFLFPFHIYNFMNIYYV